jgi:predicted transcriptional regulator
VATVGIGPGRIAADSKSEPTSIVATPEFIFINDQGRHMTTETVSERVRELAEHHEMDESAVIQQAVEAGVETLYRDMIVSRYLDDEIAREEAIEHLGVELVEELDAAREAVEEDVKWGLQA